jgi:glycosyltransferase involved in cell wall biosynthesis
VSDRLASIIINNYNYGRFLPSAIDSALKQTHAPTEVIVVDDGSTDNSRDIIAGYGTRVRPVFKTNGGMASTYNAGFPLSRGEVVFILDSDDALLPSAVAEACKQFDDPAVAKVHWPLWTMDPCGTKTANIIPEQSLSEGDLREFIIQYGPESHVSPPTSGNAWSRRFLETVLPMPEVEFRQHADTYLTTLAAVFGTVKTLAEPQGFYRVHSDNDFACKPLDEQNRRNLENYQHRCCALSSYLRRLGRESAPETWQSGNPHYELMQRIYTASEDIKACTPPGSVLILVDEENWGRPTSANKVIGGRRVLPFLEKDGLYWGPPADDVSAIRECERLRQSGASFIAFAWPAFWWLDYYQGLHSYLRSTFPCVLSNERLVLFDLRARDGSALSGVRAATIACTASNIA